MITCAWIWIYVGAFLMLLELLAPGFIIFFFGLSAASVGLCRACFGEAFTQTWQLAAFSAFSILYLVVLRRWLKSVFMGGKVCTKENFGLESEFISRTGRVTEAIRPPETGRILIGDAEWTASSAVPLAAGVAVRVVAQNNLTMSVEAI